MIDDGDQGEVDLNIDLPPREISQEGDGDASMASEAARVVAGAHFAADVPRSCTFPIAPSVSK